MKTIARFINDQAGVTAIEYALIASITATAIIVWANLMGDTLTATFESIATNLAGGAGDAGGAGG